MMKWNRRRLKRRLPPRRTNLKLGFKRVEVRCLHAALSTRTGILNQCSYFIGKRKAEAEADPKREKKKSREISEPLEESEPEPGKGVPV